MEISTVLQKRLNRFEQRVLLKLRDGLIPGASAIHIMIVPINIEDINVVLGQTECWPWALMHPKTVCTENGKSS